MSASYIYTVNGIPSRVVKLPYGVPRTKVYLSNQSVVDDMFIGGPDVAENQGLLLVKQTGTGVAFRIEVELYAGQELYGVMRAGKTGVLHVGYSA